MNVLLVYGTAEGQTRKIARFVADRMRRNGHRVLLVNAAEQVGQLSPREFDAVLIAASVHAGRFQNAVADFVRRNLGAICSRTNAFLAVSLSAASRDSHDTEGLQRCVADFITRTGWTPGRIHHVAGALRYSAYGPIKRWVMRYIASRRGGPTDAGRDHELTDWVDLAQFIDTLLTSESAPRETSAAS